MKTEMNTIKKETIKNPKKLPEFEIKIKSLDEESAIDINTKTKTFICLIPEEKEISVHCVGAFSPKLIVGFIEGVDAVKKDLLKSGLEQALTGLSDCLKNLPDEEDE